MSMNKEIVWELPPKENNPRNSEGAFLSLKNGVILFIYSRFRGLSAADDAQADLAKIESNDDGQTWSEPEILFTAEDQQAQNLMSVSLLRLANGNIGLFYLIRKNYGDTRPYMRSSSDEGKTWSEPTCCVPWPGYHVLNNDRVICLKSGRLLFPAAYHKTTGEYCDEDCDIHPSASIHFFFSDDYGKTWDTLLNYITLNNAHFATLQEPGIVELESGVLWGFARTELGRQYEFFSHDGGNGWTTAEPSRFTSPCSPLSMKRNPFDRSLWAVWNPIPQYATRILSPVGWGRSPLVLSVSYDDGETWSEPQTLESDKDSGYCYTAIHFTETSVLLGYCAGGPQDGCCLSRLRIRKLPLYPNSKGKITGK